MNAVNSKILLSILWIGLLSLQAFAGSYLVDKSKDREYIQTIISERDKNPQIRALWWNILDGALNDSKEKPLSKNLKFIIENLRLDFLILGEFSVDSLDEETLKLLRETYPYVSFLPQNKRVQHLGIAVFSKHYMKLTEAIEISASTRSSSNYTTNLYEEKWLNKPNEAITYDRFYYRLDTKVLGRSFSIIPTHIVNPWGAITTGKYSSFKVAREFISGTNNPLINQIRRYKENLRNSFGEKLDKKAFFAIGDYNIPDEIIPLGYYLSGFTPTFAPLAYKHLTDGLKELCKPDEPSFPTLASKEIHNVPAIKIDHIFANEKMGPGEGKILTFSGSDHYPLFVSF